MAGIYHDLEQIFVALNARYFDNAIKAGICWGRLGNNPSKRQRSIRLGSYCIESKTITIHPALDQALVPKLCLERVIHHEMLHQKHPIKKTGSRHCIHGPAFKSDESLFEGAKLADAWFKANLDKLFSFKKNRP